MPHLTVVETGPHIAVVGGDLACITLRGPHGALASGLGARGPWSSHLRLSFVLHWGLGPWCVVAEASGLLETILLARLALQELALIILPFINFGNLCKDSLVHQGVEIRVDLCVRIDGPRGGGELGLFQISKAIKKTLTYAMLVRLNSPTG